MSFDGFIFFLCPSFSSPRMTKGTKGAKESEDTDAATAAPEVEQATKVDDTDPRWHLLFSNYNKPPIWEWFKWFIPTIYDDLGMVCHCYNILLYPHDNIWIYLARRQDDELLETL